MRSRTRRAQSTGAHSALTAADLAGGVHPNAGGYSKMATVWYDALQSVPGSLGGDSAAPGRTGGMHHGLLTR